MRKAVDRVYTSIVSRTREIRCGEYLLATYDKGDLNGIYLYREGEAMEYIGRSLLPKKLDTLRSFIAFGYYKDNIVTICHIPHTIFCEDMSLGKFLGKVAGTDYFGILNIVNEVEVWRNADKSFKEFAKHLNPKNTPLGLWEDEFYVFLQGDMWEKLEKTYGDVTKVYYKYNSVTEDRHLLVVDAYRLAKKKRQRLDYRQCVEDTEMATMPLLWRELKDCLENTTYTILHYTPDGGIDEYVLVESCEGTVVDIAWSRRRTGVPDRKVYIANLILDNKPSLLVPTNALVNTPIGIGSRVKYNNRHNLLLYATSENLTLPVCPDCGKPLSIDELEDGKFVHQCGRDAKSIIKANF